VLKLAETQINSFHADGLILPGRIIDDDTVELFRDAFERIFSGEYIQDTHLLN
jgi:hypothetical protein